MKMTFNRKLMLAVLADEIDGRQPPHSASSIEYTLDNAFNYKWTDEPYSSMTTLPTKRQIYRTLKDLLGAGLIVGARIKSNCSNTQLAYWENEYQLSGDVYKNSLTTDCTMTYNKVNRAKYGVSFFGSVFDMGLPAQEIAPLLLKVKSLIQKTHPDKANGYEAQFKQMKQCLDWIKTGIPLPTPIQASSDQSTNTKGLTNG